jgi:hypothetical protein
MHILGPILRWLASKYTASKMSKVVIQKLFVDNVQILKVDK